MKNRQPASILALRLRALGAQALASGQRGAPSSQRTLDVGSDGVEQPVALVPSPSIDDDQVRQRRVHRARIAVTPGRMARCARRGPNIRSLTHGAR